MRRDGQSFGWIGDGSLTAPRRDRGIPVRTWGLRAPVTRVNGLWFVLAGLFMAVTVLTPAKARQAALYVSPETDLPSSIPPVFEELCARLAAFRLVQPISLHVRTGERLECPPLLLRISPPDKAIATTIFTTVRQADVGPTEVPRVRFKLNALDPASKDKAVALIERAVRSILRSYGYELPEALAPDLKEMMDGDHESGSIRLQVLAEHEDPNRYNIFLSVSQP